MVKIKNSNKLKIKEELCKACGFCIYFCPDKALEYSCTFNEQGYHPVKWKGDCSLCGKCYIVCPDFAIEIGKNDEALER